MSIRTGMRGTPSLPCWITKAAISGYENAHVLCPRETRLYGTESLYGDWDGAVLLLAKDFAPSRIVHDRIRDGDPRPYRHEKTMRTNRRLEGLAAPYEDQGLLYGSALANLLRADGMLSGTLPNRDAAIAYGAQVFQFVIEHMPNLTKVVCLGQDAWDCACLATGLHGNWAARRDAGQPLGRLGAAYPPAARVALATIERPWRALSPAV
jgi:hypothetical protein